MTRVVGRQHSRKGLGSESVHPDTRAILTASRALSSETALPRLLQVLAWNVLKYAGAQRCAVVLHQDGKFRVEAEVRTSWDGVDGVIESRNMTEADIPLGIFMTVTRTRRRVLLDDAFWTGTFSRDPDVIRRRLRSVLCMPLLKQSELVGILYIENNLLSGAFTDEKSSVLEVFALQAAALLENATRHAGSAESNAQRETVEQELRDSKDELARVASLATMGQLVASIAHEVYQPLASIATSAATALSAVRRDGPNHLKIEEELERIQSESACVRDVVQRLRGLVKRSAPSFCAFDLHAAIQEVLLVTQSQFNRLSVRVVADEIATPRYVWGDKVQIQQVVLNLVVSGVEAMHDIIDHERCLTIKSVVAKGKVKLSVEDTGAGIMGELSDDTSEPFAATNHTGIGARLIICRSIVQAHAGRLTAERLTPHGTRFELTLFEPGRQTDLSPPGPITRFNNVF
nr:ATP-binding protein [Burkholderia sp. Ac-20365]